MHVYKSFMPQTWGGVEQSIYQLCKNSQNENKIFCLGDRDQIDRYEDIEVIRCQTSLNYASCPISLSALIKFKKYAQWADIIHYHYPYPFADLLHFLAGSKKKYIITYHSDIIKQKFLRLLYYPLEQWFLAGASKIIATSPNYARSSYNLQKFKDKVEIITIGIDPHSYQQPNPKNCKRLKEKYGNYLLFLGQLRYYKGLHILLEAMKGEDYQLVIAGGGNINQYQLGKNSHFLGQISEQEKADLLSSCHCVILPSHLRSEALGIALIEGAMFGKPLICCAINSGTDYINIDRQTGIVTQPNDPIALRGAMRYLQENPNLAKQMGKMARKRFEQLFKSAAMSARYQELYNTLCYASGKDG